MQEKREQSIIHQAMVMEHMPQMADFVYKLYNRKLLEYQEKKRVCFSRSFLPFPNLFFQQEELSRYDPERDLPYDPLQPALQAPKERNPSNDELSNGNNNTNSSEYVPSRQHQISGTSLQHDPNQGSSTIENLDEEDDDEDVYDPNKPTLFQKLQSKQSEGKRSAHSSADFHSSLYFRSIERRSESSKAIDFIRKFYFFQNFF